MEFQPRQRSRRRRGRQNRPMRDMMTNVMDMMDDWNQAIYSPAMGMMQDAVASWINMMQPARRMMDAPQGKRYQRHDCRCGDNCDCDNCYCTICDADIVIYSRMGERRVIPFVIENNRHRARDIKIEISDFVKSDDKAVKLAATVIRPAEFKLEACSEQEVILVANMLPSNIEQTGVAGDVDTLRDPAAVSTNVPGRTNIPDVETCTVFYADLRVEGCEMRPMRIAIALMPRDCEPMGIECSCGCCS